MVLGLVIVAVPSVLVGVYVVMADGSLGRAEKYVMAFTVTGLAALGAWLGRNRLRLFPKDLSARDDESLS